MRQAVRATGLGRLVSRPLTTSPTPFRCAAPGIGRHERGLSGLRRVTLPLASLPGAIKTIGSERWFSSKKPVFEAGEAPSFAFAFE